MTHSLVICIVMESLVLLQKSEVDSGSLSDNKANACNNFVVVGSLESDNPLPRAQGQFLALTFFAVRVTKSDTKRFDKPFKAKLNSLQQFPFAFFY